MGNVGGIETSLRGPCEPAPLPVLLEDSRTLNSTSGRVVLDGGCALEEGSLAGEAWSAPVVDSVAAAIGWTWLGGVRDARLQYGTLDLTPPAKTNNWAVATAGVC